MGHAFSFLGPRRSPSSDTSAAILPDGYCEAEKQSGCEGLTGPLAQYVSAGNDPADVNSYSSDDDELAPVEEVLAKLGDGLYVTDNYLTKQSKPMDMNIILFCQGDPGNPEWMVVAPEWQCALGFGSSIEAASGDLQSKLAATKRTFIRLKSVMDIKSIPWNPRPENAREICDGRCNGYYDEEEKAYFDELENDSSAVEWRTIQV